MASRLEPNRYQSPVPAELGWYVEKGLAKDRAARYQSVTEMIDHLHRVMSGQFAVQCPVTFMKRVGGSGVRFADRHPVALMIGLGSFTALVGFAVFEARAHGRLSQGATTWTYALPIHMYLSVRASSVSLRSGSPG